MYWSFSCTAFCYPSSNCRIPFLYSHISALLQNTALSVVFIWSLYNQSRVKTTQWMLLIQKTIKDLTRLCQAITADEVTHPNLTAIIFDSLVAYVWGLLLFWWKMTTKLKFWVFFVKYLCTLCNPVFNENAR